jgi:predicted transcriptional regulator
LFNFKRGLSMSATAIQHYTGADEMTIKEFRKLMRQLVDEVGLNELARQRGFPPSSLSQWLNDPDPDKEPPKKIVAAFGKRIRKTIVDDRKK